MQAGLLNSHEVQDFQKNGFSGPYELCSPEQMAEIRGDILALLEDDRKTALPEMIQELNPYMQAGFGLHRQHVDIYNLAANREIVGRIQSLFGEDVLLWRTMFFIKESGAKLIPWHQDYDGWAIEPYMAISAWIAIDDVDRENGCLEFIPGSHRTYFPLVATEKDCMDGFPRMSDPGLFDENSSVAVEMKAGQFVLFNERVLHKSAANSSNRRRIGLAARYIPPLVKLLDKDDDAMLLSGHDHLGFNQLSTPPISA